LTSQITDAGTHETSDWWALYTRHQHEKTVTEMLSAKGFEVFLPLYGSIRRWKDRSKKITLPLFPCYVFVRGGLDRRLQVVTTPGIHTILFHGERVAMIPGAEIEAIRKAVEGPFQVEPHPFLKCGERVRVIRGSLIGVEGVLIRKKNLYRLILSVDMMAKSVAVEIDTTDVEPVPARSSNGIGPGQQFAGTGRFGEALLYGDRQIASACKDLCSNCLDCPRPGHKPLTVLNRSHLE
jgi:transcription antitermination factor NusG